MTGDVRLRRHPTRHPWGAAVDAFVGLAGVQTREPEADGQSMRAFLAMSVSGSTLFIGGETPDLRPNCAANEETLS